MIMIKIDGWKETLSEKVKHSSGFRIPRANRITTLIDMPLYVYQSSDNPSHFSPSPFRDNKTNV